MGRPPLLFVAHFDEALRFFEPVLAGLGPARVHIVPWFERDGNRGRSPELDRLEERGFRVADPAEVRGGAYRTAIVHTESFPVGGQRFFLDEAYRFVSRVVFLFHATGAAVDSTVAAADVLLAHTEKQAEESIRPYRERMERLVRLGPRREPMVAQSGPSRRILVLPRPDSDAQKLLTALAGAPRTLDIRVRLSDPDAPSLPLPPHVSAAGPGTSSAELLEWCDTVVADGGFAMYEALWMGKRLIVAREPKAVEGSLRDKRDSMLERSLSPLSWFDSAAVWNRLADGPYWEGEGHAHMRYASDRIFGPRSAVATGPFHLETAAAAGDSQEVWRARAAEEYGVTWDGRKPICVLFSGLYDRFDCVAATVRELIPDHAVMLKPYSRTFSDEQLDKLAREGCVVIRSDGNRFVPNTLRMLSDFILASPASSTFTSSLLLRRRVVGVMGSMYFPKTNESLSFEDARRAYGYGPLIEARLGPILDFERPKDVRARLADAAYWSAYDAELSAVLLSYFGQVQLEGATERTVRAILDVDATAGRGQNPRAL